MKKVNTNGCISLRNVKVNNLKSVNLDIPYDQLIAFCGLSGSGKSSLAIDTLYAEGQRRYIESFSAYTRQFLEKLDKPDVERIEGIQPAIAVTSRPLTQFCRSTVGTTTETSDYLRLLFSKIGQVYCRCCGREVKRDSPDSILESFKKIKEGTRIMVAFTPPVESFRAKQQTDFESEWRESGFLRVIVQGNSYRLDEGGIPLEKFAAARLLYLADIPLQEEDLYSTQKTSAVTDTDSADNEDNVNGDESDNFETIDNNESETSEDESPDSSDPLENSEISESSETNDEEYKQSNHLLTLSMDENTLVRNYLKKSEALRKSGGPPPLFFVVDRITAGKTKEERVRESLETAFQYGSSQCWIFCEGTHFLEGSINGFPTKSDDGEVKIGHHYDIDGELWTLFGFSRKLSCEDCGIEYPTLEPKLFSFNSPLGACPFCEGFGNIMVLNKEAIFNRNKSLKEGAIIPWNSSSYQHKKNELLTKAEQYGIRIEVPFKDLTEEERDFVIKGNNDFEGLDGFFIRLQRQKYKMHIRVFLSRWRHYHTCPICNGTRLRQEALAVRLGANCPPHKETSDSITNEKISDEKISSEENTPQYFNIHDFSSMPISDLINVIDHLILTDWQCKLGNDSLTQVRNRLQYLKEVGLGYLTLDRPLKTLSEGEQRRVCLTSVLGSTLVDVLYVLDEPSIGLHPFDIQKLLKSILRLRDRGNTVVVVEHEESILKAADRIVEIGPEAGAGGGQIVFEGTYDEIYHSEKSLTGSYLSGRRTGGASCKRRFLDKGFLELTDASGYNLKHVNAIFPLGVLCLVTGISGAGKSSLVQETLYPAICAKLGRESADGLPYGEILGVENIDDVMLVDQSPIGRSPRSNPVTYLKIFDDIRNLFADMPLARSRNYNAGYFSFNVDGGRCNTCKGEGYIVVDMQFMADTYMKCPQCNGRRYQREILDVLYRGRNISEVLNMTVREAFTFFRGQTKIQQKLKRLMEVGLDYLQLGQPANTLSGGESQRLKLVSALANVRKGKCLFIMDEPTTGLHFADVVQLIDSFDALINTGHSLIVVEHNVQMMKAADYIVDLGPGAANEGGSIVAEGMPEEIILCPESKTGEILRHCLPKTIH